MYEKGIREKEKKMSKGTAIFLHLLAVFFSILGALCFARGFAYNGRTQPEKATVLFNSQEDRTVKQYLHFYALTEPFGNYDSDEDRQFYFVWKNWNEKIYIVCMSKEDFENNREVYEYFYGRGEGIFPPTGKIEGYSVRIFRTMKKDAIKVFNFHMPGSPIHLSEDNFNEYVGEYYLDATCGPRKDDRAMKAILQGLLLLGIGVTLFVVVIYERRKKEADSYGERDGKEPSGSLTGNLLGAAFGAVVGSLLGILFYMAGIAAGAALCTAIGGADIGYKDRSGREAKGLPFFLCIVFGMLAMLIVCSITWVWRIMDIMESVNPEGIPFGITFVFLPWMLEEFELTNSFVKDLLSGLPLAASYIVTTWMIRKWGVKE